MASVILDAGHGGFDNGATYQNRKEKNDTLRMVLEVGNILQNEDIDVLYTRTEDVYQTPARKAEIANESGADYFVSIHRNAAEFPNQYEGVQTLVYENSGAPQIFAENIDEELEKVGYHNIGTEVRKNLVVLRRTTMPAVLVEVGFIDNDFDNQLFDEKFEETAQAIADGIQKSIQQIEGNISIAAQKPFSIELGMFSHRENADHLAKGLQKEGIDCYICGAENYFRVCHGAFSDLEGAWEKAQRLYEKGFEVRVIQRG